MDDTAKFFGASQKISCNFISRVTNEGKVSIGKWQYSFIELFSILEKIYNTVEENGKRDNYKNGSGRDNP